MLRNGRNGCGAVDQELLAEVQAVFAPVKNLGHVEGLPENN